MSPRHTHLWCVTTTTSGPDRPYAGGMAGDSGPAASFVAWLDEVGVDGFIHLADDLWAEVPALHEGPPGTRDALRSSVVSHLPVLRASFSSDDHGTSALPTAARDFGELMALADAPLSAILRSYEVGHAKMWSGYTRFLRASPLPDPHRADELEASSILMFQYMQAMTSETVVSFNQVRMSMMQERESRRGEIVKGVLAGTLDPSALYERVGYRVDETHIGYVAWTDDDSVSGQVGESARRHIAALARQQLAVPSGTSSVYGWFTPISHSTYRRLRNLKLSPGVQVAFGAPRAGIEGFRHTHEEALLSSRVPSRPGQNACFPDDSVAILVSQRHDLATRFVDDHLGPLLRHEGRNRLLPTLQQFLETSGSPSRCGRRLGIHPNTVSQRIRRIEDILGYPIDPEDLSLRVALVVQPALTTETS